MVVGVEKVLQVLPRLVMAAVVAAADGGVFQGAVHPLDLTIRPRMRRHGGGRQEQLIRDTTISGRWR